MKGPNFNINGPKPRVLVAPLEWGLGHATRCIPIIRALIANGCEVIIGAEGAAKALLETEFPQLVFLPLKGYRMQYSRKGSWLPLKILLQFPKMIRSIYNEHRWLKKLVKQGCIDAVISDNRFGLYHSAIPSVYITHQLTIKTGNRFTQWLAGRIHYFFINKFAVCWVPDAAGEINLAGEMSHPLRLPKIPVQYLGPLSRFEKNNTGKKYDLSIIISGPEPQRSIFENLLLDQLTDYKGKVLFVRGLPNLSTTKPPLPENKEFNDLNVEFQDHLSSSALNEAIEASGIIISRCGYTTVMDLVKLKKPAILIPTPGQTEQEYLAERLMDKRIFYCTNQLSFSLPVALQQLTSLCLQQPAMSQDGYKDVIKKFITDLQLG